MKTYGKLLNQEIKKIAKRHRWPIWFCYNDKRKGWRRLSYCRNGYRASARTKQEIRKKVALLLESLGIMADVYWRECERYAYGSYDKLCIRIPGQE